MFRFFFKRDPGISIGSMIWWAIASNTLSIIFFFLYRTRYRHGQKVPKEGPVLYVVNHQSMFDPILASIGNSRRPVAFFAKSSLFNNKYFGFLIRSLNAIPVAKGGAGDRAAMKQCLEVLKQGRVLLVFPEGTRQTYGPVAPFQPGILLIIKRAKPTIVPIAIDGCRFAWPKGGKPKFFKRLGVTYGDPISHEQVLAEANPLEFLRERIEDIRLEIENDLGLAPGELPDSMDSARKDEDGSKSNEEDKRESSEEESHPQESGGRKKRVQFKLMIAATGL